MNRPENKTLKEVVRVIYENGNKWISNKTICEYINWDETDISLNTITAGTNKLIPSLESWVSKGILLHVFTGEYLYQIPNDKSILKGFGIEYPISSDLMYIDKNTTNSVVYTWSKNRKGVFDIDNGITKVNEIGYIEVNENTYKNNLLKKGDIVYLYKTEQQKGIIGYGTISKCNTNEVTIKYTSLSLEPIIYEQYLVSNKMVFSHLSSAFINPSIASNLQSAIETNTSNLNIEILEISFDFKINESLKYSAETRKKRLLNAVKYPLKKTAYKEYYDRNPDVVAEVLQRAKGYCEKCNNPAPFIRASNNTPYLEVHHIKMLSNGGEDTIENSIALCPNCHRKMHFG